MNSEYTATIKFTNGSGDEFEMPLSETQLATVLIILGINHVNGIEFTCYSDEMLEAFHKIDGNPLKIKF